MGEMLECGAEGEGGKKETKNIRRGLVSEY